MALRTRNRATCSFSGGNHRVSPTRRVRVGERKNLKSHDQGRTFQIIKNTLTDALGYHLYTAVIDAQSVVPQHRERIFLVASRNGEPLNSLNSRRKG